MIRVARKSFAPALGLLIALSATTIVVDSAVACPSCGKAAASQPNGRSLEKGFNLSIVLLMSTPFAILGGLTALFSWEIRRANLRAATNAASSASAAKLAAATPSRRVAGSDDL